jgi:hypothetical protein
VSVRPHGRRRVVAGSSRRRGCAGVASRPSVDGVDASSPLHDATTTATDPTRNNRREIGCIAAVLPIPIDVGDRRPGQNA